jgi:hypothetical protein
MPDKLPTTALRRRKLPIAIQNLREIREADYYYVDKSEHALNLIDNGKYYFLSRPRRFGKSLFLDTLKELFEGNEKLFKGLSAETRWDWNIRYPVIRISFGGGVLKSTTDLDHSLNEQLSTLEQTFKLPAEFPDARSRFKRLIYRLATTTGHGVVALTPTNVGAVSSATKPARRFATRLN